MAHLLNPERIMKVLEDGTIESIKEVFPIEGSKNTLRITDVYADKHVHVDDIHAQRKSRLLGKTWATGIYGDFELVNKKTDKVIDRKEKVRLLSLPHITRRYSYIVDGNEYQVDNQWRLKSGVYTRKRADGDLETQFNLSKGRGFRMLFNPKKKEFILNYGTTNIQLLPALQALGISDDQIKGEWGNKLFAGATANIKKNQLPKLAKALVVIPPTPACSLAKGKLGEVVQVEPLNSSTSISTTPGAPPMTKAEVESPTALPLCLPVVIDPVEAQVAPL